MATHTISMHSYREIKWEGFKDLYPSFQRTAPMISNDGTQSLVVFLFDDEDDAIAFKLAHQ